MINIKNFNSNILKVDKKSYKNIEIYYIWCITVKYINDEDTYSVNPLYFIIDCVDGYIEKNNVNKLLIFAYEI